MRSFLIVQFNWLTTAVDGLAKADEVVMAVELFWAGNEVVEVSNTRLTKQAKLIDFIFRGFERDFKWPTENWMTNVGYLNRIGVQKKTGHNFKYIPGR